MVLDPVHIGLSVVAILLAFVVHEYAHGYVAYRLGDPTPKYEGRLSLNPLIHLDPIGSLVMLSSMIVSNGQVVIGWAKPVQFDTENLRHEFLDAAVIAAAGPVSNVLLAFLCGLPSLLGLVDPRFVLPLVAANLGLGMFNLLPVPPLDGWKVLQGLLPRSLARSMRGAEARAGMVPLFVLLAVFWIFGDLFLSPLFAFLLKLFTGQS
ncbi:MAG: site-2 protease family protein [Armatimonadetes bacterium]|nr:site-2 protease family protein [Armatimonadota bacterium]